MICSLLPRRSRIRPGRPARPDPFPPAIALAGLLLGITGPLQAGSAGSTSSAGVDRSDTRPNFLFILADDLGYGDLGCYGCPDIRTPHLDHLAQQGVRLTQHYANCASCSPTRAAFMTGRYPQRIGLEWAVWYQTPNEGLPAGEPSIASLLHDAGYATAIAGKWHLGYSDGWRPLQHGFDLFFGCLGGNINYFKYYDKTGTHDLFLGDRPYHTTGYMTDLIADHAIQFLHRIKNKPFFLYVPFTAPHFPFQGPGDADQPFAWHRGTRQDHYRPMVEAMDRAVGRILAALDRLGLAERTLVVFTSDNGGESLARNAPFSGRKGTLLEGGLRVPAIARWPGHLPAGRLCDQPSATMDWTATFLALAHVTPPPHRPLDGIDLMPALTGRTVQYDRPLFFRLRGPYRKFVAEQRAVRIGDWKYIEGTDGDKHVPGLGPGPYLFNLARDRRETTNLLLAEPQHAARLKAALRAWEDDVDPPLYDQYNAALKKIRDNGGKNPWPKPRPDRPPSSTPADSASHTNPPTADRPNFIVIFCDDMGYADIGPFGATGYPTPSLDRLAREGRRFTDFHVAASICSPSRAALLTGCYPLRVGVPYNFNPRSTNGLDPHALTIAEVLKPAGYATAIFGKWHEGHRPPFLPTRQGFDRFFGLPYSNDMWPFHPTKGKTFPDLPLMENEQVVKCPVTPDDQKHLTAWYTQRAVRFIEEHRHQPFLLYLPHAMPHVPLFASDPFAGKTARGLFGDVVSEIDWSVGQILDALQRTGLDRRTLVVFTSDNGPWLLYGDHAGSAGPLRSGKGSCFEGGFRVPCIMRWTGRIPAGTTCNQLAATIDLLPTFAALAGTPLPPGHRIDGKDIRPLLFARPGARSPHQVFYYFDGTSLQAVRSGPWKLVLAHTDGQPDPPGSKGKPGKMRRVQYPQALYNLQTDLGETTDLSQQYPQVRDRLLRLARQAFEDLDIQRPAR